MFVKTVQGNVKKGCDVEIGPKTLIVGPNGSGKSTIVNTVELALTARAGDIAGRVDIAREADVMSLAQNGATELEAVATFDDGVVAAYRTSGSTAKAKKATGDKPADRCHDEVLPIRTLREAVLGSPQTARKYLLSKVGGGVTREDIENLLPEPVRETWRMASAKYAQSIPAGDVLVGVLESAGKHQRDATSEAKAQREAAKLVSGGRASPPSDTEVRAAKTARDTARAAYEEAAALSNIEKSLAEVRSDIETVEAAIEGLEQIFETNIAILNSLGDKPVVQPIFDHVLPVMKESCDAGECLCCGGAAPSADVIATVEKHIETVKGKSAAHEAHEATIEKTKAEFKKRAKVFEELTARELELVAKKGAAPDLTASRAAYDAAEARHNELKSARDAWNTVQRAESVAIESERQAQAWKALKESCEDAVARTLDAALLAFIRQVNDRLPTTDVFDLRLKDGDREVVQFGLVRDGKLHTALSGAEWARVMAAMASACVPAGTYACIIPEERAFDPATLEAVLAALTDTEHQVIITSPVKPKKVPKGWTVIERG